MESTAAWDMMLAFPPCTYLTQLARATGQTRPRRAHQDAAVDFVRRSGKRPYLECASRTHQAA